MVKTTVYLPEELDVRLDAEAASSGVSKAELIRRGIAMVLEISPRPTRSRPLPVFDSGRRLTTAEMDQHIYEHIRERASRR
jgi:hypothetical protein